MSLLLPTKIITDAWVKATWEEYIEAIADPSFIKAKGYYFQQKMRIEAMPVGTAHASHHALLITIISLFCALKKIKVNVLDNCSYRKKGIVEFQPDISYYLGDCANAVPIDAGIVDLEIYPVPNLVIEIANSSLNDDKGEKRLLYESLDIGEYWIVDVQNLKIIALAIADGGSRQIRRSEVLPGLEIDVLEESLKISINQDQSIAIAQLISKWQS
jgi:Uma2 family endonuclease